MSLIWRAVLFVLALSLLLSGVLSPDQREDFVVGTDISPSDITDFYYTYDASTAPPHYQRYRFYVEDGRRLFYHETREGGGWPQTEEDITASGTLELTEEQWSIFCRLLDGGTADPREESLDSGDAGPWLYIYWGGGEAEGLEFRFASLEKGAAFETFCAELSGEQIPETGAPESPEAEDLL